MKASTWKVRAAILAALTTASPFVSAELITYQGQLKQNGQPMSGTVFMITRLFDAQSAGTLLGQQGVGVVPITNGLFTIQLNTADYALDAFASSDRWLELDIDGQTLTPRQRLTPAPLALYAGSAMSLNGPIHQGNGEGYFAANSAGAMEEFLYPRWSDDKTYMTVGSQGLEVRSPGPNYETRLHITGDGNVGFGTDTPAAAFRMQLAGGDGPWYGGLAAGGSQKNVVMGELNGVPTIGAHTVSLTAWTDLALNCDANGNGGNVGIGTTTPAHRLHVNGTSLFESSNGFTYIKADAPPAGLRTWALAIDGGSGALYIGPAPDNPQGNQFNSAPFQIQRGAPTSSLAVLDNGRTQVRALSIIGGADIAEPFDVTNARSGAERADAAPGMVVCIDPANPGRLRLSAKAYDRTVAGIISGANGIDPGMVLRQQSSVADGTHPVALTGRVYCHVDADANGAIQPGDLLTTSSTPGHAMKATDNTRSQGAIIGKAMSSLDSGKGLVLVLVSLQ